MSGGGQRARRPERTPGETSIEGSRTRMTVRTTSKTVTFIHPFNLNGMDKTQPAGTYTVETDEELLQTSLPAYRRISTLMRLPARSIGTMLTQIVETDPEELSRALGRGAQPDETMPQ